MFPFRTTIDSHGSPVVTMSLIVVNISMFIIQQSLPVQQEAAFVRTHGLVPAFLFSQVAAERYGADYGSLLPIITSTFLHADWLHLIINMWTLWLFGMPVEDRMGTWRFLLFYLACGVGGSMAHLVTNMGSTVPTVGASGAIAGLLGAFAWLFPRARIAVVVPIIIIPLIFHVPGLLFTIVWFALQIVPGLTGLFHGAFGGVAWWTHIGGFALGLGLAAGMFPRRKRPGPWSR